MDFGNFRKNKIASTAQDISILKVLWMLNCQGNDYPVELLPLHLNGEYLTGFPCQLIVYLVCSNVSFVSVKQVTGAVTLVLSFC